MLNLKFSEVYFEQPGKKVFGLDMNGLKVIKELDIYERVGFGAAYDECIEFKLNKSAKTLTVGKESVPYDGQLILRFVAVVDNPKVNALLVAKGTLADYRRHQRPKRQKKVKEEEDEVEFTLDPWRNHQLPAATISSLPPFPLQVLPPLPLVHVHETSNVAIRVCNCSVAVSFVGATCGTTAIVCLLAWMLLRAVRV